VPPKVKCGLQNGGDAESHKVRFRAGVVFAFYAIPTNPNATVCITTCLGKVFCYKFSPLPYIYM